MEDVHNHVFIFSGLINTFKVCDYSIRDFKVELTIPNELEYQLAVI